MENKIEVKTRYGTLVAEPSGDPNYPGIWVSLRRPRVGEDGEYEMNLVLVESEQESDDEQQLRVLVWSDPECEDYTHKVVAQFDTVDETIIS